MSAVPTQHTDNSTSIVTNDADLSWLESTFSRVSVGAKLVRDGARFRVVLQ
jgi:hypothetical protein